MASCGQDFTCGGQFTSGAGDSDWQPCDKHAADRPYFVEIYIAQTNAMFSNRTFPKTREECLASLHKKNNK